MTSAEGILYPPFDPKKSYYGTAQEYGDEGIGLKYYYGSLAEAWARAEEERRFYIPDEQTARGANGGKADPVYPSQSDPLGMPGWVRWEYSP